MKSSFDQINKNTPIQIYIYTNLNDNLTNFKT